MNRKFRFYSGGNTEDIELAIAHLSREYRSIFLVGFSLGGNLVLNYASRARKNGIISGCIAISTPVHLPSAIAQIEKRTLFVYRWRFFLQLKGKLKKKRKTNPGLVLPSLLSRVRSIRKFDRYVTAPAFGFVDENEYYDRSSSSHHLHKIQIPTLLLNAADDPILPSPCYPLGAGESSRTLLVELTPSGGHCGFIIPGEKETWAEKRSYEFIQSIQKKTHASLPEMVS